MPTFPYPRIHLSSLIQRDAAIEVFRKSGLPEPVLLSIFALADDDHDGVLAPKEFCVAFHLIVCLRCVLVFFIAHFCLVN